MNWGLRLVALVVGLQLGLVGQAKTQGWVGIGHFEIAPSIIWHDSLSNKTLVAGWYASFDSSTVIGYGHLVGDTIIPIGCGFGVDCGVSIPLYAQLPRIWSFARFQGELYVAGEFDLAGGTVCLGIAKWGNNDWEPIGSGLRMNDGFRGLGYRLKVFEDELYVSGVFDSINGIEAHGLAKFDGSTWSPVYDLPLFSGVTTSPNFIYDMQWYNSEFYILGNFSSSEPGSPLVDIAKWNGAEWVPVGPGITGGFNSLFRSCLYQGKLLIAGTYNQIRNPGSIPGNNIVLWDGQNWDTMRGGVMDNGSSGAIWDVIVKDNLVYVCGSFDQADDIPAKQVAMWDGESWCAFGDQGEFQTGCIAFKGDTLLMNYWAAATSWTQDPSGMARWLGPANGTQCQPVSASPPATPALSFSIFPNPGDGLVQVRWEASKPGPVQIEVHDIYGRKISSKSLHQREGSNTAELDLGHLPAGTYLVRMLSGDGQVTVKYVRL